MIILDTNVISEFLRPEPSHSVREWLDAQTAIEVTTTAITVAELRLGVMRLPDGARRREIERGVDQALDLFRGRILPFDERAATIYADIVATRDARGRPISAADAQIAAIALSQRGALATRNTRDFEHLDLELIDPWTVAQP
ncbi:type II toxin-antitoxin system VapC family toxin [Agromyces atrinae]|uniref:type II toxin-antitoxin system VapC family toxin n=1 Tax=Agromyces atrinae TaxID=592376 RepID=UPI001F57B289|nr:type II toxin-antitoxin system VapC family toxin [Agromyces atrinae]MCI2956414.1 type II toxin-antitoxin system VapC family toxin [Agromyces atrinae]